MNPNPNPSLTSAKPTSPRSTIVSSNTNHPSCSNGTLNPANCLPLIQNQIQHITCKPQLSHIRCKKPKKEKTSTLIKKPLPCRECGKKFTSVKSLRGLMRCHPESMNPPAKGPVMGHVILDQSQNTDEDIQAANNLLLISNGAYEEWMGEVKKKCLEKIKGGFEKGKRHGHNDHDMQVDEESMCWNTQMKISYAEEEEEETMPTPMVPTTPLCSTMTQYSPLSNNEMSRTPEKRSLCDLYEMTSDLGMIFHDVYGASF